MTAAPADPPLLGGLTTNQDLDPARLRQAFGVFPSGVVAVAAEVDGALVGLAASSFSSVSLDPPLVSFSIANTSKTWPDLRRATRVGVTILAEHHGDVCRQLAGPVDHRFTGVPVRVTDDSAVLLEEGLARFDCSLYREVEAGDHTIVLLQLHGVEHDDEAQLPGSPLVFHRSAFGRLSRARTASTTSATSHKRETR
jgi:flavin reductase (DIM6/NTAB) family NADH-FMN oxidoreductase RutF